MKRVALGLVLLLWAVAGQAQTRRPFATFRQLHGETRLGVRLEYAAGNLRVAPGPASELYRMNLWYDESRYLPVSDFDARRGAVVLGLRPAGEGGVRVVSLDQLSQVATVSLSPSADLALDLALGAADADIELGGLRISRLTVKTGAKDAAGNPLVSQFTSTFTTAAIADNTAPTIVSRSPANNATGVATNTLVTVTFSEPMDPTTINSTNSATATRRSKLSRP